MLYFIDDSENQILSLNSVEYWEDNDEKNDGWSRDKGAYRSL